MPNGVANWPDNCDPRQAEGGPCFCNDGYHEGYPAPWKFEVNTGDATPLYLWAVGRWLVPFNRREPLQDACIFELRPEPPRLIQLAKIFNPFYPAGGWNVKYELRFFPDEATPGVFAFGDILQVFPLPADTHPPYAVAGGDGPWPDPVIVRPVAWNAL